MKRITKFLTVAALLVAGVAQAQTAAEVQAKFNEAAAAYNEKKFDVAAPLFVEVIEMGETAEEDVDATIKQAKGFAVLSYQNTGKLFAQKKDFDNALNSFRESRDLATSFMDLRNKQTAETFISGVYGLKISEKFKAEDFAGAAAIAEEAYAENDKDYKNAITGAKSYYKMGNTAKGDEMYNKLIALGESNARYAAAKTQALKSMEADKMAVVIAAIGAKDNAKALEAVNGLIAVAPKSPTALMARVQVLNDMKNYAEVVKYGPEAVSAQTTALNKSNAAFFVAIAYQELQDLPKAIEYYNQVVQGGNVETAKKIVEALKKQQAQEAAAA